VVSASFCISYPLVYFLTYHSFFEPPGEWLRSKLDKATQKTAEAQENLAQLHAMRNPHGTHGERYTNDFFKDQWDREQAYHCETRVSYREKQKKELGRLLCLQEQLETEWFVAPGSH
jgi:ubiquitin